MSEYKYACPVCRQHIKCDSSLAGTAMKCPTCFQMIIAPQAPATPGQTLILFGKRADELSLPKTAENTPQVPALKFLPMGVIILLILVVVSGVITVAVRQGAFQSNPTDEVTTNGMISATTPQKVHK